MKRELHWLVVVSMSTIIGVVDRSQVAMSTQVAVSTMSISLMVTSATPVSPAPTVS